MVIVRLGGSGIHIPDELGKCKNPGFVSCGVVKRGVLIIAISSRACWHYPKVSRRQHAAIVCVDGCDQDPPLRNAYVGSHTSI